MFWNTVLKILKTIIFVPLAIIGAICATPFAALLMLISFPWEVIEAIWSKKLW